MDLIRIRITEEKPNTSAWDWRPICKVCNRPVSEVEVMHPFNYAPGYPGLVADCIRRYRVFCHGEKEEHILGIWAAMEIQIQKKRLPDAFVSKKILPP